MKFVKLEELREEQKIAIIHGDRIYGPYFYKYIKGNIFGEPYVHCEDDLGQVFSLYADRGNKYLVFEENDEVKDVKETKNSVDNDSENLSFGDTIYVFLPQTGSYKKTTVSEFIKLKNGSLLVGWSDGNTRHWSKIEDCNRAEE